MKRVLIFLFCFLFSFSAYSVETNDFWTSEAANPVTALTALAERARAFGERIPQEKVYVHMDNTCYFLGDTIWFAAYTRRTDSGKPSKVSRVLYAELWNHDGFLVERKLVEMKEGRGHGYFALPDTLYSGYFELRAYTRWQLNWGQTEHPHSKYIEDYFYTKAMAKEYFRDYDKLYSRVFPVYDKPREEGVFARDMTLRPLRRYFRSVDKVRSLKLSLFPEGGSLVAGVPCRVAFEVAEDDGKVVDGKLTLFADSEKDGELTTAMTEHRGRGTLIFTPEVGKKYCAVFTANDGQIVSETLRAETDGVALQVRHESEVTGSAAPFVGEWIFTARAEGKAKGIPLGLMVMHEGNTSYFTELTNDEIRISNDQLPAGVNQVTVFDGNGRVWADRLFFVTNTKLMRPTMMVEGVKESYRPFEEIDLTLRIRQRDTASGSFSLTVRDALRQDRTYDTGNIMTEMLLTSEIKGFVPQPEWFFEADDEEHRRGLDLLMLTQGWRRFSWRDMSAKADWEPEHPAEQAQTIKGVVYNYDSWNPAHPAEETPVLTDGHFNYSIDSHTGTQPKREVLVFAKFIKLDESRQVIGGKVTTENCQFNIALPRFYGDCMFFLAASDSSKWGRIWSDFSKTGKVKKENKRLATPAEYYVRLDWPYPRFVKPYTYYQMNTEDYSYGLVSEESKDTHLFNEVIVARRHNGLRSFSFNRPACVVDAYEAGNAAMDAGLITNLYNTHLIATGTIINYFGDMGLDRKYVTTLYYDTVWARRYNPNTIRSAQWEQDKNFNQRFWINTNMPPYEDWYKYEHLKNIDKVYLYSDYSPRWQGNVQYNQENQPSVEISLHSYPDHSERINYRNRCYLLHGFAYQEDFYHPDYKRNPPREGQKDYRRTLYWNPDLKLDEEGKAHIRLFNGSQTTSLQAEAEGMTEGGGFLFNKP